MQYREPDPDDDRIDAAPSEMEAIERRKDWATILRTMDLQNFWGVYEARYALSSVKAKRGTRRRYAWGIYLSVQSGVTREEAMQAAMRAGLPIAMRSGSRERIGASQ